MNGMLTLEEIILRIGEYFLLLREGDDARANKMNVISAEVNVIST